MRIKQPASALKNKLNINNKKLSIYCKSFRGICRRACFYVFAMILEHIGQFKLRVPTKVTSKRISKANYFYRTSISLTIAHPQSTEILFT